MTRYTNKQLKEARSAIEDAKRKLDSAGAALDAAIACLERHRQPDASQAIHDMTERFCGTKSVARRGLALVETPEGDAA